ncbi:MAG: hypothetical protein V4739_06285, partial [Pseudomonadota bacterium]
TKLLAMDPAQITGLMGRGLTLAQISETNPEERLHLLSGDESFANLVRGLIGTGMNVHDVAIHAGTVVSPAEATSEFLEKVRQRLAKGDSGAAAIAWARYGDKLSVEELDDPAFLTDLLFTDPTWAPASQGEMATELISALSYARENYDIFEAAEQVAVPDSCTDNEWFANAGVFQLAGMSADSPEWAQIEDTLGRSLSKEKREAAIQAGKGLADNWAYLCQNAEALNLSLRKDTTDVIDFTDDNLRDANLSPLIDLLGNAPATMGGNSMNVLSALEYVRQHMDIYDSAEEFADKNKKDHDGKFINTGVFQVAGLGVEAAEWGHIESKLGRVLSKDERKLAIAAAKGLTENWAFLCDNAGAIGLTLARGTTDVIFFKDDRLDDLNWGVMLPKLGTPVTGDLLNSLEYARAKQLEKDLFTDGKPTPGADFKTIIGLSPAQIDNLQAMDPDAVKSLLAQKRPLSEIADLTPDTTAGLAKMDGDLLRWLLTLADHTLSDISKLTTGDLAELQGAMRAGVRQAGATEDFNDIKAETISHPINLDGGLLIFETASGERIMVTKETNLDLYNKVSDLVDKRIKAETDAVRAEFKLPPTPETDIMGMPSTTLNNPNDPNAGFMNVGQLTIKNLMDKYTGMLERGEMTKDDPRAKVLRAFQARSALVNGYSLLPYYESPRPFGTTSRTYPGGENDPEFSDMSQEDVEALIDPAAVDAQLAKLLDDPVIQVDYQAALNQSTSTLPNREELLNKISQSLESPEYTAALIAMKARGLRYEAEEMTRNDIMALTLLDPVKATEAAQKLSLNSLEVDLLTLLEDPAKVDNITFDQAVQDAISLSLQSLRSGASVLRHGSQATEDIIKLLAGTDKRTVTALATTLRQLVIDAKASGNTLNVSTFSDADWEKAMQKTFIPMELRGSVMNFFQTTQKYGVWGSIGGAAALASFGYQLANGAWGPNSSAEERWGATRDLIAFFSVIQHVGRSGAGVVDGIWNLLGKNNANSNAARTALGLDASLPKIWGGPQKTSFLPNGMSWAAVFKRYEAINDLDEIPEASRQATRNAANNLVNNSIWNPTTPLPESTVAKMGITMLKVLGTITDLVGIADIVMGALGLKKSIKEGDVGGIVANSLGIAGGVALTGAGIIGTAQLFAPLAMVGALAAPLFLVGAVLMLGGFLVTLIVGSIKRHNQLQDASNDQGEWFRDLERDGLAKPDVSNKLEYLRYAWSIYGNDDTDPNKSYFEFQQAEWDHFRNTPGSRGSSLDRLDGDLHVETELTHPDPREESDVVDTGMS